MITEIAQIDVKPGTEKDFEAAAASARGGFACLFSTADEYETAVITERRAQGRYTQNRSYWPLALFVGCALVVAGMVLLFA